jgi:predicted restriction endonuclease
MQVKNAVLIWKGEPAQPLPIEIEDGEWEPSKYWQAIREELPRETQEVIARPGATEFRNQVLREYSNRCAISGVTSTQALEVAHIVPYYGPESDDVQNAIPLRVDLHRLFDRGLLRIDYNESSKSYKISVHHFISPDYEEYDGKSLLLPDNKNSIPSKNAIDFHNDQFKDLWTVI